MNNLSPGSSDERKEKAIKVLATVNNLPSIPYVIFEVTKLLDNPASSAAQLAKIINKDQGLVTKVLTVANSPLYGIPRRVATIDFAIMILGFSHIKNIVIALSMMDAMKHISSVGFDQKKYWTHSLMIATVSKKLADDLGYAQSGEIFTAGLLHDIGIPILSKYFPSDYVKIKKAVLDENISYREAEIREFGATHQELGKALLEKWNLPETLTDVVLNHHTPSNSTNSSVFVHLVHLADYMTQKLMIGDFEWDTAYSLDKTILTKLNLGDESYIESFVIRYKSLFEEQISNFKF